MFLWTRASTHHYHWFKQWIVEGYSVRQLSAISRFSPSTLTRSIRYWLAHPPAVHTVCYSDVRHLICDGTYVEDRLGVYAVMNAETRRIIYAAYGIAEGGARLSMIYHLLAEHGLLPESATIDGNTQQIKYLRRVWPSITLQRCVVHVQRQGLSWCRRNPKRTDAKHLREIFLHLCDVKTHDQAQEFITDVDVWNERFGQAIDESTDRGWVFSDLVRARCMLLNAMPDLFHFISNDRIPSSTNTLESYFGRLKEHYRHHRGLATNHRDAYFTWYFHLVPGGKNSKK